MGATCCTRRDLEKAGVFSCLFVTQRGIDIMKILIISTGGTIGSKKDDNIHLDAPFKVVHFADKNLINGIEAMSIVIPIRIGLTSISTRTAF